MDLGLFLEILSMESTSGKERELAEFLARRLAVPGCAVFKREVGDGTLNLLFDWSGTGKPSFVFCTHLDTVAPYIEPKFVRIHAGDLLPDGKTAAMADILICGRGSNDAKGQIFTMYSACLGLQKQGFKDFGLLLLSGEETGSHGAKAWTRDCEGGDFVLVGEPTCNKLVTASKGTKSFEVTIHGKACHSGYPENGESAIMKFAEFMDAMKKTGFAEDPVLGKTTWNIGKLESDNAQNILSPELRFRIYFRTTFLSDSVVREKLLTALPPGSDVKEHGGDAPLEYFCSVEGIESAPVSFGSDAPRLDNFKKKAICGPGSIITAHTADEYVLLSDLETALKNDIRIYHGHCGTEVTEVNKVNKG